MTNNSYFLTFLASNYNLDFKKRLPSAFARQLFHFLRNGNRDGIRKKTGGKTSEVSVSNRSKIISLPFIPLKTMRYLLPLASVMVKGFPLSCLNSSNKCAIFPTFPIPLALNLGGLPGLLFLMGISSWNEGYTRPFNVFLRAISNFSIFPISPNFVCFRRFNFPDFKCFKWPNFLAI